MVDPGILKFRKRQLPDEVITREDAVGPTAWRFNKTFVEPVDDVRRFFSLDEPFSPRKILVFKNGIKQVVGATEDILLHDPNIVEFIAAPTTATPDIIDAWYLLDQADESTNWIVDESMGGTKDSVNLDFTTFFPFVSTKLMVFKNGKKLIPGASRDYVEINNTTVRLTLAPDSDDFIEATYFKQT